MDAHETPAVYQLPRSGDSKIAIQAPAMWKSSRKRASDDLDRLVRLSLDLFCVASFVGYFVRVNPAWQTVLGHSDKELRSTPFMECIHPDDRAPSQAPEKGARR